MANRTAPTIDGSPTFKRLSIKYIDFSGDERSTAIRIDAAATPAQIEALVAAANAASNANPFQVTVSEVYAGDPDVVVGMNEVFSSVFDNVVIGCGDVTVNAQQQGYIVAPQGSLIPTGDTVDTSNGNYTAFRDALLTLLGGSYAAKTARFTERREKNDSVPA